MLETEASLGSFLDDTQILCGEMTRYLCHMTPSPHRNLTSAFLHGTSEYVQA